jgi:DNA polymerase-3 subunit delta
MLHLIHGENALEQDEALARLLDELADQEMLGLNRETLEPPLTLGELRRACDTLPFLGGSRVVVVKGALKKGRDSWLKKLVDYLPALPETTLLIFLERQSLPKRHPVLKLAKSQGRVQHFKVPSSRDLPGWIRARCKKRGCVIEPRAMMLLAQNIGSNLYQLDQEIQKLQLYKGDQGPISEEDVRLLVPYVQSADVIFDMVDALGQRKPHIAAQHLHRLLDVGDQHPLSIFGMVVRQYRLLIQVRWLMERGKTEREIAQRLKLHPYVAKKMRSQATFFTEEQLRGAYRLLVESDLAIKTGKLTPEAALDLLVAQLTRL